MAVDRCPNTAHGNHIYRMHADGCDDAKFFHHHCAFCGRIQVFNDTTKEWK